MLELADVPRAPLVLEEQGLGVVPTFPTPTDKATVERAFHSLKDALAPLFALTNRLAASVPQLRRPGLARPLGTLLIAVFLRVDQAGPRHLPHPLAAADPEALRVIVAEQRDRARAEARSVRLFLEALPRSCADASETHHRPAHASKRRRLLPSAP